MSADAGGMWFLTGRPAWRNAGDHLTLNVDQNSLQRHQGFSENDFRHGQRGLADPS